MIKVLMIGPKFGGIEAYISKLKAEMELCGASVDWVGSTRESSPYIPSQKKWRESFEVKEMAAKLVRNVDFSKYDIIGFHFGKNDIEQYVPVILRGSQVKVKRTIYFVHFLSWNLFSEYLGDEVAHKNVSDCVFNYFDGYIFYGHSPKNLLEDMANKMLPGIISWYPETHPFLQHSESENQSFHNELLGDSNPNWPLIVLPGYAADYKDHNIILDALALVRRNLNLTFAGRGWEKRLGFRQKSIGASNVRVVDRELNYSEFRDSIEHSLFGLFPYRPPKDPKQRFQGSGTLPNFIALEKPCIALDEALMSEYIGDAGIVVPSEEPSKLAAAIETMLDAVNYENYLTKAKKRAHLFSCSKHARECLAYFSSGQAQGAITNAV